MQTQVPLPVPLVAVAAVRPPVFPYDLTFLAPFVSSFRIFPSTLPLISLLRMTYAMASIIKKTIRGKVYYYARECRRIAGKPTIVWQKYLGKADDIIAAFRQPTPPGPNPPDSAVVTEFGAVAALYDLARRLRLAEHIDRHVPARRGPQGPSTGTYLLLAALQRCTAPASKARLAAWFERTVLRRLLPLRPAQLTSQRFWKQMHRVSAEAIVASERDLTEHLVREFDVDVRQVLFDATNFFTFIDTFNERCTLAQRGKSKEGRAALRIVGLALLVSTDFHVPLSHHTYPGNQPDSPTFASLTDELVQRHRLLVNQVEDITLIFDKGNNSLDNLQAVDQSPYHFIGSLVPTQHPDLLALPARRFEPLDGDGLPGVSACRTQAEVFGQQRTVVVTYNAKLFVAQSRTWLREIAKRQRLLAELQGRLQRRRDGEIRGGKPPTVASVRKKVQGWLSSADLRTLFTVEVGEQGGLPELHYRFEEAVWQRLQSERLGKTLLFTDREEWTDAQVVRGYRSQHQVEAAFRDLKNPQHLALRPQHHWTDQKIRVHVFCCVLALTLCSLLRRELHRRGLERSLPQLLEELGNIREVAVAYPADGTNGRPSVQITLTELTESQRQLYDALELRRYRSP
jgi:transposase